MFKWLIKINRYFNYLKNVLKRLHIFKTFV